MYTIYAFVLLYSRDMGQGCVSRGGPEMVSILHGSVGWSCMAWLELNHIGLVFTKVVHCSAMHRGKHG